ncbi:MAG: ammonia-forming cytochrome c nitrite reductase [Ignavibacteria bacterium]|nr:ammonia-forming cytochrome c nitrite reductase [Ignavibacteria bacterium]
MTETNTKSSPFLKWGLFIAVVIIVFLLGLLATSIVERRSESITRLLPKNELSEFEPRNEVWGENYPREFESYLRTLDTNFQSRYAGSGTVDYLERFPELVILWAGYAFSQEYNQGRGHAWAIEDIRNILRTGGVEKSPQPSTCWTCKGPDVPRLISLIGPEKFYNQKWIDLGADVVNPIGCQDCHEPNTMNLRITRPALAEAMRKQGREPESFTHQEMRSLVCAQCHVEYYFAKDPKSYLVFPWANGFSADSMEKYYDEIEFSDWTHKLSRAPMLKGQHPDYELYRTGIHAARGVACADCHMPYKIEGGVKFSDHHIQSPLNNIANSCQVCHRQSEEQLLADVYERQDRVLEVRRIAEKSLAKVHLEAKAAWDNGASEEEMSTVLKLIRHAQWRWDWVAAANSVGFHSPVEALRVLSTSIQKSEQASALINQILVKKNVPIPVPLPDFSTKEKAQKLIGLNMDSLRMDKNELLQKLVPEWDKKAQQRQGTLKKYSLSVK